MEAAPLLDDAQQAEVLQRLMAGGAPSAVCQNLGLSITSYYRTLAENEAFAGCARQVRNTLMQNVLTVLYQEAMRGNVTAQRQFLQLSRSDSAQSPDETNDIDPGISPHELADAYRAAGLDLPPELEALLGRAPGAEEP